VGRHRHELGETLFTKLKERYELKELILGGQAMRFHERMIMLSVLDGLWKDHLLNMDHLKEGIGLRGYGQQDPLVAYKKESFDMFEAMMNRFQEDTVRYLFLMQIVGPDGQPITRPPQRPPETLDLPFEAAGQPVLPQTVAGRLGAGTPANGNGSHAPAQATQPRPGSNPVSIPVNAPSTTIDALERDFKRKKERELEMARSAGAGDTSANGNVTQRRTGEKVGPNAPCPCGSGKKYKKCHGA
jgi:preprotein translocase subunit SecA